MKRQVLAALWLVAIVSGSAHAQQTIVGVDRSTDWSTAGVSGGIPPRPTICQTLDPGVTAEAIRAALAGCPPGQVVFLNPGTYSIEGLRLDSNDVTLRGAGADQTILAFTDTLNCSGPFAAICVGAQWIRVSATSAPQGGANWTDGFSVGTTVITLSDMFGSLQVGDQIILDQLNDTEDTGGVFVSCSPTFTDEGGCSPSEGWGRGQNHHAIVQAINGNVITIDPAIRMPNWSVAKWPVAIWSGQRPRRGVGIEDLTVDLSLLSADDSGSAGILFMGAVNSWVRGVRVNDAWRAHIRFYQSSRITVRDSYLYDGKTIHSTSYGFEPYGVSDCLIENNIIDFRTSPFSISGPGSGCVIAYNYARNQPWDSPTDYQPGTILFHEAGISHYLLEGNDVGTVWHDDIHGTTQFHTIFRNLIRGDAAKSANTSILQINSYGRYFNIVGNVLGRGTYYTTYEPSGSTGGGNTFIYSLGEPPASGVPSDPLVKTTLFRWGNYDTVTLTNRFEPSEVPSGLGAFAQPVPSTQALPQSFYLPGRPPWFGSVLFPPAGPDVTDGDITGYDGRASRIPARVCFESLSAGDGSDFNADTCYGALFRAPHAPSNVKIVPGG